MSGSFRGDEAPSGVAADGFYQKGSSVAALLRMMETLPQSRDERAKGNALSAKCVQSELLRPEMERENDAHHRPIEYACARAS
jgi:hypothetical protein